jgi:hypothetical protein
LRGGVDPAVAALGLLALYQGVLVLVRAGWDGQQAQALIDDAFDRLEEPRRTRACPPGNALPHADPN